MIKVVVDKEELEIHEKATAKELAEKLNLSGPDQAAAVSINGFLKDLSTELNEGDLIFFPSFDDAKGKEVFWHTTAHVLAQAVLRLYPNAKPTIGPPIENGFYYDFADLEISDSDLEAIEKEMKAIIKENHVSEREVFSSKKEALAAFEGNPYKQEIIQELPEEEILTGYRQGEFFDFCRGPHLNRLGKIKAVKLFKTSGAYWRANKDNEMLTRIYGISFPDKASLQEYVTFLEEAKKRDHKILGPKLDLFSLHEEAPGMPFIHPKGMIVWNALLSYLRSCLVKASYIEIKTPTMMTKDLWEKSGHWANYREHMFISEVENRSFAIKPMNCPGGMIFFKSRNHSYRQLPLRVAEIGNVHRYEPSGSLSGLFRVRSFHQDDAHIFMKPSDIKQEILSVLHLFDEVYKAFGLTYSLELSTKPEKNTIGSDEEWTVATEGLKQALDESGRSYRINEGDGAFYGPKIDFHIKDALGRTWQCGTIQLDMALPLRFDLEYTDQDGQRKRPVMIHRAIFGSIERFFGILIEHFKGRFPLWLSPHHVRVITVAERHEPFGRKVLETLQEGGLIADIDASNESVSKKIREAQVSQINYILTIGDSEVESGLLSLRTRENQQFKDLSLEEFLKNCTCEIESKSLKPLYQSKS